MLALAHLNKEEEEEEKMRNFRIWPISVLPLCEGCRTSKHILAFRKACKNDCKHSNITENPIVVELRGVN